MKKLIVLIMFLFATNLYSACCLTPLYDSLHQLDFKKGENIPRWGTLPFDLIKCKYEPRCDIVIICWENAVVGVS